MTKKVMVEISEEQFAEAAKEEIRRLKAEVKKLTKDITKLHERLNQQYNAEHFLQAVRAAAGDYLDMHEYHSGC